MYLRSVLVLLLACGLAVADSDQDLKYALRLGARGMKQMALKILTDLENSSDPDAARAGRFGKARLTKFEAELARRRFLRALKEGSKPEVSREEVIALYKDAAPKVEEYVKARPDNDDARFLLGELLQEYAEFLTGADYPDAQKDVRDNLLSANKAEASRLFEGAIESFDKVAHRWRNILPEKVAPDNPDYIRMSQAEFNRGRARYRWACIYPKGPHFINKIDTAVEELDSFLQQHYDQAFGAYAMLYLGRCFYEKAIRLGDAGEGEVAINYFENVYLQVDENPAGPQNSDIIGEAFYRYAKTCNALARGDGNLKKPQPIYYQNTAKAGTLIGQRLKQGRKRNWALRARLEVAEAEAAQLHFGNAVSTAGDVLSTARVEGNLAVVKLATSKLTAWVANVRGSGALDGRLLFQIGSSLAGQGRPANAITFFEKAIAASKTEDEKEKVGYPAQLEIAKIYRGDKRLFAAARVAWDLVQDFLKSGADQDSDFGLTAAEACNQARKCWRAIQDATKSTEHQDKYSSVVNTFRSKFPSHPENSDQEYSVAIEAFTSGDYANAAEKLAAVSPGSNNYWRAQRRVPQCFRVLAQKEKDPAKAKQWHKKALDAAKKLLAISEANPAEGAVKGLQYGLLYQAMSEASLGLWKQALADIDVYLGKYPGKFAKRGLEVQIKIDGHLAQGEIKNAEAALNMLKEKEPRSPYIRESVRDVYVALKALYKATASGDSRKDMANRAANLWLEHLSAKDETKLNESDHFLLAEALRDAGRWGEAGEAFEAAGALTAVKKKPFFALKAAEMTFKKAIEGKRDGTINQTEYLKTLKKTRELFTEVLIPESAKRQATLDSLKNYKLYPRKKTFSVIKRRPKVLITAAEVYHESSKGPGGRWIAVRLIDYLHTFTLPVKDEEKPKLAELVTTWWDGAELKLKIFLAIAGSGGEAGRAGKNKGYSFATKIIFQYQSMDGEERVRRIKALAEALK